MWLKLSWRCVAVTASAKAVGMTNFQGVPLTLMAKLPMDFKLLGKSTHRAFDILAGEARDTADRKTVLAKLGDVMLNCTSCHAGYRFVVEGGGPPERLHRLFDRDR